MMHRFPALAPLLGMLAAALATATLVAPSPASALPASAPPASVPFSGVPRVGALFTSADGVLGSHFCTAAVVDSPGHDLLVTAGHCAVPAGSGRARNGLVFVPGYHDGVQPYGQWPVVRVTADVRWSQQGDQDYDVAFLTTVPGAGAGGRPVQDAVGSEAIGFNTPPTAPAVVVGYPSRTQRPVHCGSGLRAQSPTQLEFDCPGLPGGTSGSPLLTGVGPSGAGRGTVVGVIGGYQQGGLTPDISYSPYFGAAIAAVYRAAVLEG
jgi:V8-like Glu-specific endopeptidase